MFRLGLLLLAVVILVGCGGTAASSAPTAQLTSVPAAASLKDIDLETLLVQKGDLPASLTAAMGIDAPSKLFELMPAATKQGAKAFKRGKGDGGAVTIFLYQTPQEVAKGYAVIVQGFTEEAQTAGFGDQSVVGKVFELNKNLSAAYRERWIDAAMTRCYAVVHVSMKENHPNDVRTNMIAYLKRLDKRLQAAVCS